MIYMRPYNSFETKNVKFLVDKQIDFTTIQITATGLKKSILDATAPVRAYFKEKGIHDYDNQLQGELGKRTVLSYLLTEGEIHVTSTSLYRPVTKKGDPRLWVGKVRGVEYLHADDIFAIIAFKGCLYVINLTTIDIPKVCKSIIDTPLKDFIAEISKVSTCISDELLSLIRDRMTDWVPAEVTADTGIGRTIESLLGIDMNDSKDPDYKGIELKSHRRNAKVRNTLFTQTPDWNLSRCKSGREIVDRYGYIPADSDKKTLQVTLTANRPNQQGLGLSVMPTKGILEADEFNPYPLADGSFTKVTDVAVWTLLKLHERLLTKHHETFWIDTATEVRKGIEYFKVVSVEHTKNPIVGQFDVLLDQGEIQLDFLLCRPSGHGDTYSFKIRQRSRNLLFPESSIYNF